MDKEKRKPEVKKSEFEKVVNDTAKSRKLSPYERTRNTVYATGNKWARENFEATH